MCGFKSQWIQKSPKMAHVTSTFQPWFCSSPPQFHCANRRFFRISVYYPDDDDDDDEDGNNDSYNRISRCAFRRSSEESNDSSIGFTIDGSSWGDPNKWLNSEGDRQKVNDSITLRRPRRCLLRRLSHIIPYTYCETEFTVYWDWDSKCNELRSALWA